MKKFNFPNFYFVSFLFILTLSACKDEYPSIPSQDELNPVTSDSTNNGTETVTSPKSFEILPGEGRLKMKWGVKEGNNIAKTVVYWNGESDSIVVDVSDINGQQILDTIIDLPEGTYNFTSYNYDENGNRSEKTTATGRSYGKKYRNSIVKNRELDTTDVVDNFSITWGDKPNESAINILLKYTNTDGNEIVDTIDAAEKQTVINDLKFGEELQYQTVYRPEEDAIDTFMTILQSIPYVIKVDKSKWSGKHLPNDAKVSNIQYAWDGLWSKDFNNPYSGNSLGYKGITTDEPIWGAKPTWITIDLGALVQLDSFHIYLYRQFQQQCLRKYEIWGTESIDGSGDWDNWTKLVSMENKKPSGSAEGVLTEADKEAWKNGSASKISWDRPKVRYIRIKCLQNYFAYYGEGTTSSNRNNYNFDLAEISFWQVIE